MSVSPPSERIQIIAEKKRISLNKLAVEAELSNSQILYSIKSGTVKVITADIAGKLKTAAPEFHYNWIRFGREPMFETDSDVSVDQSVLSFQEFMLTEIASLKAKIKDTLAADEYEDLKNKLSNLHNKITNEQKSENNKNNKSEG